MTCQYCKREVHQKYRKKYCSDCADEAMKEQARGYSKANRVYIKRKCKGCKKDLTGTKKIKYCSRCQIKYY